MSSRTSSYREKRANEKSKGARPQGKGNSCIKAEAQLQQGRSEAIVQRPREHEPDCQLDDCSGDGACKRRADSSRGWKVGDRVSYNSSNGYARTGVIAEIINDGALVDEGHPYKSWIEFKYLEPCLQCLMNLPELEEQQSLETVSASKQPSSLKSTLMPYLSSSIASPTSQSTTTSEPIIHHQESMTSIGCHSPALEPAAPDCEPDLSTQNQLCGLKHCGALQTLSPASSSSKILQGLSTEDYEQFLEDSEWSDIVGTIHKSYQLRNWERPRRGKDFSLLPTPTTYAKGSGKYRPAGATKLEQSLRQFINPGDKLHPAVPGWMMGFPPGWVEFVLMDGGKTFQPPEIAECAAILPSAENATTCMVGQSSQNKLRSPSVESCTCTPNLSQTVKLNEETGDYGLLLGDNNKSPSKDTVHSNISPSKKSPSTNRRRKGEGNGSIHWRTRTWNGKDYPQAYYHWKENGNKRSKYIPKQLLGDVQKAEAAKRPVIEILRLLGVVPRPNKQKLLGDTQISPSTGEEQLEISPSNKSPSKTRRHKGKGSGSIHWKTISRNGKDYPQAWYHYEFWSEGDRLVKSSKYIPKRLVGRIQKLEEEKAPVREILKVLGVG